MRKVHPEFAYQSRELEGQIEGILGDPPDHKNYQRMVDALVGEYAQGGGIEDVNMLAFALVDQIEFNDPKGLLAEAEDYEFGDAARVFAMASCKGDEAAKMYAAIAESMPDLARQAIITAFLHKNPRRWDDDDQSLDQLSRNDDGDDVDDEDVASDDFAQMFDKDGD
ncbi:MULTISPECIES: hypothetical protein [unclassified Duganella]|uniref:hypothetical protein n=1 Tax=unclassified Duganella TaxID=2636909 RepID=UPI0008920438|nr:MULTISPECIES: hypothetical protein [unclassified Duganella]SDH09084.1 hypothetical protein SAMN05216320_109243 [Duganella sp. OV458]SDK17099.1 hypothetical protein SAMN05428973_10939 [Duganella sp. OV510]